MFVQPNSQYIFPVRVGKFIRDMPSSSGEDCLTVVEVPENRYDEAIHHLRWNFFADEPLNNAVRLCAKGESQYELEQHCLLTLKQGYSRMLVNSKGTVSDSSLYHEIHIIIILFSFTYPYLFIWELMIIFIVSFLFLFAYLLITRCLNNSIFFIN